MKKVAKKITKKTVKKVVKKSVQKQSKKVAKKPVKKVTKKTSPKKKPVIVAVSGGFDPIHIGHVRMFNEAKALGDKLIVIINNDAWLRTKKGQEFMSAEERKEIIEAFEAVDDVVVTSHGENDPDRSVCRELASIRPHIFANGGDRKPDGDPVPEVILCEELGIEMLYNIGVGGKVQSSSWLIKRSEEAKAKKTEK
jgi:D-beta-D-heptose 7-phosphate kinase/D-beta-D-heptose 1-phosphate adenosyltransferase